MSSSFSLTSFALKDFLEARFPYSCPFLLPFCESLVADLCLQGIVSTAL